MLSWIGDYIEQRRVEGLAAGTMEHVGSGLKIFARWARRHCRSDLRRLTRKKFEAFVAWMSTAYRGTCGPNKGRRVSREHVVKTAWEIQRLFRWLMLERRVLTNPTAHVEMKPLERRIPRGILTMGETRKLLAAPRAQTPMDLRDRAILEVLYGTAMRRAETYNLDIGDVDLTRGMVFIRQGKGRKDRAVPMGERAQEAVVKYLAGARGSLVKSAVEAALFVDYWGKRMTGNSINLIVRKHARRARIKRHITAHSIRHTCATHMMENGADLRMIQELLGHARIDTTEIYTRVLNRHLRESHRRAHPSCRRRVKKTFDTSRRVG